MVKLNIGINHLTVILNDKFLVFEKNEKEKNWEFRCVVECQPGTQKSTEDASIECSAFSSCGNYFCISFDKHIIIYHTSQWNVFCSAPGERKASCLRFFPKSKIILFANKSGCAMFYSFSESKLSKIDKIVGHNSMLTSALITVDERFIITCDRDEKIRVTNYPNVYNIERYCLGHRQFVTWLEFLPSDNEVIVSCSGDGTVRFWSYLSGRELALYSYSEDSDMNKFSDTDYDKTVITKIAMCRVKSVSILAVVQYKTNQIRILQVTKDLNNDLSVEKKHVLSLPSEPWDVGFYHQQLVCIMPNEVQPVKVWAAIENLEEKTNFQNLINYINQNFSEILKASKKLPDEIPVLFKREVDTIQEYEQRKKARLLKTGKTS